MWPDIMGVTTNASAAMHSRIKRDGHFHIKGLLSPDELSAFRPHVVAAALTIAARCEVLNLELHDDVVAKVPGPDGGHLPFLQLDHPSPFQALEGDEHALLLLLMLLLAL